MCRRAKGMECRMEVRFIVTRDQFQEDNLKDLQTMRQYKRNMGRRERIV